MTLLKNISIIFSILALGQLSCSLPPKILFFNNSQMAVAVKVDSEIYKIDHKAIVEFEFPGSRIIFIESKAGATEYNIPSLPSEYMPIVSGKREILFQLEPEGLIFVLKPTAQLPKLDLTNQPNGFPLSPQNGIKVSEAM